MANAEQEKVRAAFGKIVARAWRDPAFKAKLLADPHGTLKDQGLLVAEGMTVTVVENTDKHFHLVLPLKPDGTLSDEDLDKVTGGQGGYNVVIWDPRGEYQSGGTLDLRDY